MSDLEIASNRVLLPDGSLAPAVIAIEGERIAAVNGMGGMRRRLMAGDMLVLPGIVDLHGDAFERQVMPRPGVHFAMDIALADTDRQMAANGITTAFHAVTYSFEPGLRGRETVLAFLAARERAKGRLGVDTRLHLRHEAYNLDAVDEVCDWLRVGQVDLLAFNDHTPAMIAKAATPAALMRYVERTGLEVAELAALLGRAKERAGEVPEALERLAGAARQARVPLASHDDQSPEMRAAFRALGCTLSDFPMTEATAAAARAHGESVFLGAPNIVRGGSHLGLIDAARMVARGLCDVLTSDYYYPSLLLGALGVARKGVIPLGDAWALVSANPAAAVGLGDRGSLEAGKRADLVIVDDRDWRLPQVAATIVAGRPIFGDASLERLLNS
jgi:alpha-D-ribose 1-methylphosphonate 5-triphosphate diphosphatase